MTDIDLSDVKAGDYELIIHSWDEITSKPGQPFDFVSHKQGDKVTLDIEQARRLVKAGAVKPLEKAAKKDKTEKPDKKKSGSSDDTGAKPTSVKDILAAVGDDKVKAQEYLDAENAAETPRVSLVDGLQKVIAAEA